MPEDRDRYTREIANALQVVGLEPRPTGACLLIDDASSPDLTSSFHAAERGANAYARWLGSLSTGEEATGNLLLSVELELPQETRFSVAFGIDRRRRTDGVALELLRDASYVFLQLRSSGAEIGFPAPPDQRDVLEEALRWLDD